MKTSLTIGLTLAMTVTLASGQGPGAGRGARAMGAGPLGQGMGSGQGLGAGLGLEMMALRQTVKGAPYSGVATSSMERTLEGGNQISRSHTVKVYRDSMGRVRTETTNPQGVAIVMILDPVAGYAYRLNAANKVAIRTPLPPGPGQISAPGHRSPGARAANASGTTEDLGTQTVNGVQAKGTRTTVTIPAGAVGNAQPIQSVREVWTSTALNVPVSIKATDPRMGTTSMQLTNIVQAEPEATLFQVPPDYTVRDRGGRGRGRG